MFNSDKNKEIAIKETVDIESQVETKSDKTANESEVGQKQPDTKHGKEDMSVAHSNKSQAITKRVKTVMIVDNYEPIMKTLTDDESMTDFKKKNSIKELSKHVSREDAKEIFKQYERGDKPKECFKTRIKNYFKTTFKADIRKAAKTFFNGIFPDDCSCIVCDIEIPRASKYGLCQKHMESMPFNDKKICITCGTPTSNESVYCLVCQNYHRHFDVARSSTEYIREAARLVTGLKFFNHKWIAKYMAEIMLDTYLLNAFDAEVIVPVPISNQRLRERGYNQSMEIAKHLANRLELDVVSNAVIKHKHNEKQSDLKGQDRHKNVQGVYKMNNKAAVKGKKVLLIDDILTTGATASEISRQLKIAGASAVYVLVFASPRLRIAMDNISELVEIDVETFTEYIPI